MGPSTINNESNNYWVWEPSASTYSIASAVYLWLNSDQQGEVDCWGGWHYLWKLRAIPKVKVFVWRMLHGRTPTFAFLHKLNIGPERECVFCELEPETDEHVLWNCCKSKRSWTVVERFAGMDLDRIGSLTSGEWITKSWKVKCGDACFKAVMASCAWMIWKARCDWIFKRIAPDFLQNGYRAVDMVVSLEKKLTLRAGKLCHFPFNSSLSLFTDAAWIEQTHCCGMGFVLVNRHKTILLAGATFGRAVSCVRRELLALSGSLKSCLERNVQLQNIYIDCAVLVD